MDTNRDRALELAVETAYAGTTDDELIKRANAFLEFLSGGSTVKAEKDSQPRHLSEAPANG